MNNIEYIKLFWKHDFPDEPVVILYKVDLKHDRLAIQAIDIYADKKTKNISKFYKDVIEIVSIPTIEEFNSNEYGDEFYACPITKKEFEETWNSRIYKGTIHY